MFSFLRPDGKPAWVYRFIAGEIAVECSRYTRWDRIWASAHNYLKMGFEIIKGNEPNRKVVTCSLSVTDRFRATTENYSLKHLFKQSSFIPDKLLQFTGQWHNHSGWFESLNSDNSLQNLNFDAHHEPRIIVPGQGQELVIDVLHLQQLRYPAPILISEFDEEGKSRLDSGMRLMHENNKAIMVDLLTDEMAKKVGLVRREK